MDSVEPAPHPQPSALAFGLAGGVAAIVASLAGAAGWWLFGGMPAQAWLEYVPSALWVGALHAVALAGLAALRDAGPGPRRWVEALLAAFCVCAATRGLCFGSDVFGATWSAGRGALHVPDRVAGLVRWWPENACWLGLGVGYALAVRTRGTAWSGALLVTAHTVGLLVVVLGTQGGSRLILPSCVQSLALALPTMAVALPALERMLGRVFPAASRR